MAMAHGVESRYPFLDHRMFEFAAALPTGSRLRGLREKEILRRWASRILPERLKTRTKQPYRAPGALSLFGTGAPEWIGDYLATDAVKRAGIFSATGVEALARRCRAGLATGSRENQAIIGVLSTQLWYRQFVDNTPYVEPLDPRGATVLLNHLPSSSSDRALNPASHA